MTKTTILSTVAGGLMMASLALAGPAFAHDGGNGHGPAAPGSVNRDSIGMTFNGGIFSPEAHQIGDSVGMTFNGGIFSPEAH